MAWVRIDDRFSEHRKFAAVGPLGIALWVCGLAYANRNDTRGFIPWNIARTLVPWDYVDLDGNNTKIGLSVMAPGAVFGVGDDVDADLVIGWLIEANIWELHPGGYMIHDYEEYQPVNGEKPRIRTGRSAGGLARAATAERQGGRFAPTSNITSIKNAGDSKTAPNASITSEPPASRSRSRSRIGKEPPPKSAPARETDAGQTVLHRLWEVFTEQTGLLTPKTTDEQQFDHWLDAGCTQAHIESALAEVAGWAQAPDNPWAAFKSALGRKVVGKEATDGRTGSRGATAGAGADPGAMRGGGLGARNSRGDGSGRAANGPSGPPAARIFGSPEFIAAEAAKAAKGV